MESREGKGREKRERKEKRGKEGRGIGGEGEEEREGIWEPRNSFLATAATVQLIQ